MHQSDISSDEKFENHDGQTYQYSTEWIHALESEAHWRLYWHQQNLVQGLVQAGDTVLEIGVGTGFTANYLRSKGVQVTTLDIDSGKNPDIVTNVITYDFPHRYDHILAFEVLEHIPFDKVEELLPKLATTAQQYLMLSVPVHRAAIAHLELKIPKFPQLSWKLMRRRKKHSSVHHHWEVDDDFVLRSKLEKTFRSSGFEIVQSNSVMSAYLFYALQIRQAR